MRVVPPSELKALNAQSDVPCDLRFSYLPVEFRVPSLLAGEEVVDTYRYDSHDKSAVLRQIAKKVAVELAAPNLFQEEKNKEGKTFKNPLFSDFEWQSFSFSSGLRWNHAYSELHLLPIDRLLFRNELKEFGIDPRPGYLYLGWQFSNERIRDYETNAVSTGGRSFSEWVSMMTSAISRQRERDSAKSEITPKEEVLNAIATGSPLIIDGQSIKPWQGKLADILLATNSRVVHSQARSSDPFVVDYIIETPLELPPGFVRETADLLKRKWRASSPVVDRFIELVFEHSKSEGLQSKSLSPSAHQSIFPQGEQHLRGPDQAWKNCADPEFVQSVLIARLIGGSAWQYALGNLEMKMGGHPR